MMSSYRSFEEWLLQMSSFRTMECHATTQWCAQMWGGWSCGPRHPPDLYTRVGIHQISIWRWLSIKSLNVGDYSPDFYMGVGNHHIFIWWGWVGGIHQITICPKHISKDRYWWSSEGHPIKVFHGDCPPASISHSLPLLSRLEWNKKNDIQI